MKLTRWFGITTALLVVTGTCFAQGPGQPGQPGGDRGSRGDHGRGGHGFGLLGLAMRPEVQRELKLEDSQVEQLRQLGTEMRGIARVRFEDISKLTKEERDQKFEQFQREEARKLAEVLESRQMTRLRQLSIQQGGLRSLFRKDVQDDLRLSADQRQRIMAAMQAEGESMKQVFDQFRNGGSMSDAQREEVRKRFADVRSSTEAQLNAVLTESQRSRFQGMQGAPFKFPDRGFGPGRKPGP